MIGWQKDVHHAVNELESGLLKAMDVWVKYRLDCVVAGYESRTVVAMPYDLRRSMIKGATLYEESQKCRGGNEQHRAMCTLVALFFQQLAERFREWQAHRAELELLTTMENDLSHVSAPSATNKSNKKPKKKGKKSTLLDEQKQLPCVCKGDNHSTPVCNVPLDSEDDSLVTAPLEPPVTKDPVATVPISVKHEGDDMNDKREEMELHLQVVENETCPNKEPDNGRKPPAAPESESTSNASANNPTQTTTESNPNEGDDDDEEIGSNQAFVASKEVQSHHLYQGSRHHMLAGVHDASGFVSAEDFFVGRLVQIIKSDNVLVVQGKSL
jgi:hypothetical protein